MPRVAVYGIFRKGLEEHNILTSSRFIGERRIGGYTMYDHNGKYPYVVPGDGSIRVEVYEVEESALLTMDTLEHIDDNLFTRNGIMIEEHPVWMYIRESMMDEKDMKITSGDWRVYTEGPVHLEKAYYIFDSPFGPMGIVMAGDVLVTIKLEPEEKKGEDPPKWIMKELGEYFNGDRREFNVPYHLDGTEFQLKVWKKLQAIPYGKKKTYGEIAKAIGKPGSDRAVGNACGKNPLPLIVPCHRAISIDGIGGFSAAISKKDWLLTLEAV